MREHPSATDALQSLSGAIDTANALERARFLRAQCDARSVQILLTNSPAYPRRLLSLEDAPNPLYLLGDPALLAREKTVALVGSRKATAGGRHAAYKFAAALSAANVCVISGLAAGIDSESHTGALSAPGATIAVLGTGIDVPYPVANTALHAEIARRGLVLSEHPPGTTAFAGAFPRRNRIIAALADVVVVVEAGLKSGALITAQLADALGRAVASVPGSIENPHCAGSNQLLRDGAHVVTSPDDVLAMLSLVARTSTSTEAATSGEPKPTPRVARSSLGAALMMSAKSRGAAALDSSSAAGSSPPFAPFASATPASEISNVRRATSPQSATSADLSSRAAGSPVARAPENDSTRKNHAFPSVALADALAAGQRGGVAESALGNVETPEQRILAVLTAGPQFTDDLVRVARAGAREVTTALSMLTLAGLVVIDASGLVRRR